MREEPTALWRRSQTGEEFIYGGCKRFDRCQNLGSCSRLIKFGDGDGLADVVRFEQLGYQARWALTTDLKSQAKELAASLVVNPDSLAPVPWLVSGLESESGSQDRRLDIGADQFHDCPAVPDRLDVGF